MTHQPSQDQDLRTALEPGQTAFNAYWETPNARWDEMSDLGKAKWAQAEAKIVAAYLTPAQAPDKAGEREGLARPEDGMVFDWLDRIEHQAVVFDNNDVLWQDCFESIVSTTQTLRAHLRAVLAPQPNGTEASRGVGAETDALVDRFAVALKDKLRRAEAKHGWRNGRPDAWMNTDWQEGCQNGLEAHVRKGDPLDVAAYSAFCWHHGWSTAPIRQGADGERDADYDLVAEWQDWNASRTGDVYLGDTTSIHCLRALIREQVELSAAALTPSAPIAAPALTDGWTKPDFGPEAHAAKAAAHNDLASLRASAAPNAAPVRDDGAREVWGIEDTGDNIWVGPMRPDGRKVARIVYGQEDLRLYNEDYQARVRADARLICDSVNRSLPASAGDVPGEAQTQEAWQDINTAPRDGTKVLLRFAPPFHDRTENGVVTGEWHGNNWWLSSIWAGCQPHSSPVGWMPLPGEARTQEGGKTPAELRAETDRDFDEDLMPGGFN
jgi:hypothetical protein